MKIVKKFFSLHFHQTMATTAIEQNPEKEPDEIREKRTLEAVAFLKASSIPNVALASEKLNVPYDRLHGRMNSKSCRHDRKGRNRKLSKAQENSLCAYFNYRQLGSITALISC